MSNFILEKGEYYFCLYSLIIVIYIYIYIVNYVLCYISLKKRVGSYYTNMVKTLILMIKYKIKK